MIVLHVHVCGNNRAARVRVYRAVRAARILAHIFEVLYIKPWPNESES